MIIMPNVDLFGFLMLLPIAAEHVALLHACLYVAIASNEEITRIMISTCFFHKLVVLVTAATLQ